VVIRLRTLSHIPLLIFCGRPFIIEPEAFVEAFS